MIAAMISMARPRAVKSGWRMAVACHPLLCAFTDPENQSDQRKHQKHCVLVSCRRMLQRLDLGGVSYGSPAYIHYGIAAVYGLILWPSCFWLPEPLHPLKTGREITWFDKHR